MAQYANELPINEMKPRDWLVSQNCPITRTSVIRRLFGYNRWKSVKALLMGLVRLNIKHLIMLRKSKLYRHLFLAHSSLLRDGFSVFLLRNSDNDRLLKTVFWTASFAVDNVWTLFQSCVTL